MQFSVGIVRRFSGNFLLFRLWTRVFCWVGVGFLGVACAFGSVGKGQNSVAKKDSKIEGLTVFAVFSAKRFV